MDNDSVVIDLEARDSGFTSVLDSGLTAAQDFADGVSESLSGIEVGDGPETEVTRLMDAIHALSGEIGGLNQTQQDATHTQDDATDSSEDLLDSLGKYSQILSGIKAGWDMVSNSINAAVGYFNQWIDAAAESELQETRLRAVHKATGDAVGYTADQLVHLSEELQKVTRFEAETAQQAQAVLLGFKNIRGDVFKDTVTSAADLAEALGMDLVGATRMLGRAMQEPGEGLMALRRAGVTFTDQEKEMIETMMNAGKVMEAQNAILDKIKSSFGGVAEAIGETHTGKWEKLNNRIGDIIESLGMALIPVMDAVIPHIEQLALAGENLVPVFESIVEWASNTKDGLMSYLKPVFEWLVEALIGTTAAIETMVVKWADVFANIGSTISHSIVKMYNVVEYYFTSVVADLLTWFADNWVDIFTDIMNAHNKILENIGRNTYDFMVYLGDVLSGKTMAPFKMTGLLDGFEATLSELPKIRERVEGEMEKNLREEMERSGGDVLADFEMRFKRNKEFLDGLFKDKNGKPIGMDAKPDLDFNVDDPKKEKEKKDKDKEGDRENRLEEIQALAKRIESSGVKSDAEKAAEKVAAAINGAAEDVIDAMGVNGAQDDSIGHKIAAEAKAVNMTLQEEVVEAVEGISDGIEEGLREVLGEFENRNREDFLSSIQAIVDMDNNAKQHAKQMHAATVEIKNSIAATADSTKKISESALPAYYQ